PRRLQSLRMQCHDHRPAWSDDADELPVIGIRISGFRQLRQLGVAADIGEVDRRFLSGSLVKRRAGEIPGGEEPAGRRKNEDEPRPDAEQQSAFERAPGPLLLGGTVSSRQSRLNLRLRTRRQPCEELRISIRMRGYAGVEVRSSSCE